MTKPAMDKQFFEIQNQLQSLFNQIDSFQLEKLNALFGNNSNLFKNVLEYLIKGYDPNDKAIIALLMMLYSLLMIQEVAKEKETIENEKDQKIKQIESDQIYRFVIYEIYKIITPYRIAGETDLENFMSNVALRGMDFAIKQQKINMDKIPDATEELEVRKKSFVEFVKSQGFQSRAKGLSI